MNAGELEPSNVFDLLVRSTLFTKQPSGLAIGPGATILWAHRLCPGPT